MLIRCNALAKLPIKVMHYTDEKGAVEDRDHSLFRLLSLRPNPFTNIHDFVFGTKFQELEYGNAFWVVDRVRGKPQGIYLLNSTRVQIMVDDIGLLKKSNSVYYLYNDPHYGEIIYTSDDIIHFKNFPTNSIVGTSVKKYMADVIENEQHAGKVIKNKYKSGLQDPVIVQYAGEYNNNLKNKIVKKFSELGGAANAGKVIPVPVDFKVSQMETKLVNNQFFELQGLTTKQIENAFGVKSFQLNDMEKSTYHNIEQQNKAFYCDTMQNDVTTHEQEMSYKLLTRQEQNKGYYVGINVDSILRSDPETRAKVYQIGIDAGYMSREEVRKKEGMPYKEHTEELTVSNGASIPLKDLGKQYAGGGEETNGENT